MTRKKKKRRREENEERKGKKQRRRKEEEKDPPKKRRAKREKDMRQRKCSGQCKQDYTTKKEKECEKEFVSCSCSLFVPPSFPLGMHLALP